MSHLLRPSSFAQELRPVGASSQYTKFVDEIKHLGQFLESALTKALGVVYYDEIQATTQDLSPLLDICGDFRETLANCRELLHDLSPKVGIRLNMIKLEAAERLRKRLAIHNRKVRFSQCVFVNAAFVA